MYGAWVSKDEIIPVCDFEAHDDVALEIIQKLLNPKPGHIEPKKYSAFRIMLRLGYIRIKYHEKDCNIIDVANYYPFGKFSSFQREVINSSLYRDYSHLYGWHMDRIMDMNKKDNGW